LFFGENEVSENLRRTIKNVKNAHVKYEIIRYVENSVPTTQEIVAYL
jgi:hypothetical protein